MAGHSRLKDRVLSYAYVPAMTEERVAANTCERDSGEDGARRGAGHDDPCVSETRPRYAAYFFSEVLLLRGSSAGLT